LSKMERELDIYKACFPGMDMDFYTERCLDEIRREMRDIRDAPTVEKAMDVIRWWGCWGVFDEPTEPEYDLRAAVVAVREEWKNPGAGKKWAESKKRKTGMTRSDIEVFQEVYNDPDNETWCDKQLRTLPDWALRAWDLLAEIAGMEVSDRRGWVAFSDRNRDRIKELLGEES